MKLIKDLYNILPLFICHSSEMSIKLSVIYTLRSFSQPKHIAMPRCSVDIKTSSFRRAHNPIIPASHSVTFSRRRAAFVFYSTTCISTWPSPQNPHVPLWCVDARRIYSLVSFPEVQTLDISKCRRAAKANSFSRDDIISLFPLPSRAVHGRETTIEERRAKRGSLKIRSWNYRYPPRDLRGREDRRVVSQSVPRSRDPLRVQREREREREREVHW